MCDSKMDSAGNKSAHSSGLKSPTHVTLGGMTQMSSRRSQGASWNRVSRRLLVSLRYLFWLLPVPGHGGCVHEVVKHKT